MSSTTNRIVHVLELELSRIYLEQHTVQPSNTSYVVQPPLTPHSF